MSIVRRNRRAGVIALFIGMVPTAAFAQQRQRSLPLPEGTSAIRGTLTDALTKEPIAGCTVRASLVNTTATSVMRNGMVTTAADGTYAFAGIVDGSYFLMIECPSHLRACLPPDGPVDPRCGNLTLFKDQQRSPVDFHLTPAATVRGRVVDSNGRPVAKATVRIGGPFVGNTLAFNQAGMTKDDGSYEVGGLAAGSWAFEVEVPPAPGAHRSPLVYYPGVLKRDEAGLVDVVPGKAKEGVIITVPAVLDRTLTVRIPPPDATMTDVSVSVIRAEPLMTRRMDLDADGQVVIKGLVGGRYVVMATATAGRERWVDYQAIDFLDESIELALQPRPAGRIRGRVITDRGGLPPLDGASIGAAWIDGGVILNPLSPEEGAVGPDGRFEIEGVFGRRIIQLGRFDPAWQIESVREGRSDMAASGVDVTPGNTTEVTVVVRPR